MAIFEDASGFWNDYDYEDDSGFWDDSGSRSSTRGFADLAVGAGNSRMTILISRGWRRSDIYFLDSVAHLGIAG